ncbi:hypothetical protein FOA52_014526 [Chlamydomonas sp. UWO 241]|nr:hypothetical protein FOA52_014526 [Chlamydomonas sp. UWO 241]
MSVSRALGTAPIKPPASPGGARGAPSPGARGGLRSASSGGSGGSWGDGLVNAASGRGAAAVRSGFETPLLTPAASAEWGGEGGESSAGGAQASTPAAAAAAAAAASPPPPQCSARPLADTDAGADADAAAAGNGYCQRDGAPLPSLPPPLRAGTPPLPDHEPWRECIIAEPELFEYAVHQGSEFLLLASDGVWDKVRNSEACTRVRRWLCDDGLDAQAASELLVKYALDLGSADNVSALVLRFSGRPMRALLGNANSALRRVRSAAVMKAAPMHAEVAAQLETAAARGDAAMGAGTRQCRVLKSSEGANIVMALMLYAQSPGVYAHEVYAQARLAYQLQGGKAKGALGQVVASQKKRRVASTA